MCLIDPTRINRSIIQLWKQDSSLDYQVLNSTPSLKGEKEWTRRSCMRLFTCSCSRRPASLITQGRSWTVIRLSRGNKGRKTTSPTSAIYKSASFDSTGYMQAGNEFSKTRDKTRDLRHTGWFSRKYNWNQIQY